MHVLKIQTFAFRLGKALKSGTVFKFLSGISFVNLQTSTGDCFEQMMR